MPGAGIVAMRITAAGRTAGMGGPFPFPRDGRQGWSPDLPSAPSENYDGVARTGLCGKMPLLVWTTTNALSAAGLYGTTTVVCVGLKRQIDRCTAAPI